MLHYREEADQALTSLEADPSRARLLERLEAVLDHINDAPGDAAVRQHRLVDTAWGPGPNWVITVSVGEDEWAIVWFPSDERDVQVIAYVGPLPA